MLKRITVFIPIFVGILWIGTAQETKIYTHDQKDYQDALALFNNEQYQAAQTIFEKVKLTTKDYETSRQ